MRLSYSFLATVLLIATVPGSAFTNSEGNQSGMTTLNSAAWGHESPTNRYGDTATRSLRSNNVQDNESDDTALSEDEERGLLNYLRLKRWLWSGKHPSEVHKLVGKTNADKFNEMWHQAQAAKEAARLKKLARSGQ